MLNKSTNSVMHTIQLPDDFEYQIINTTDGVLNRTIYHITGITENEYHAIKKGDTITINRGPHTFKIIPEHILCFGEIDFNKNSDDCEVLDTFKWLNNLVLCGKHMPSRYDYETHTCTSPTPKMLWTETFEISTYCRYLHGCIGKPKLTLIFKQTI